MNRFVDHVDQKAHRLAQHVEYRLDAGYTSGSVMDALTGKNRRFVGRLKSNARLDKLAAEHLWRPPGRPPAGGYEDVIELGPYQADSWERAQRLILVVVDKPHPVTGQLNLMPRYFFLVTNWDEEARDGERLLAHYRRRGTFEDRLGEFNAAVGVHLSHRNFKENEAAMLLAMLAFNLTTICRNELENSVGGCWDLTRFQLFVLKVGAEIVKHSRRLVMRIAESAVPLWRRLVACIESWSGATEPRAHPSGFIPPPHHAHLSEVLRT